MKVIRGETDVSSITIVSENLFCMSTFAKHSINLLEAVKVAMGKSFLIRDEEVLFGRRNPIGENPFHKNISIIKLLFPEILPPKRLCTRMAYGDIVASGLQRALYQGNISIQSDAIGSCYEIDFHACKVVVRDSIVNLVFSEI